jgi:AMP-binding enzyme
MRDVAAGYADSLATAGIAAGDRVVVMSENRIEVLDLWMGCAWLGAVLVPINTALRGGQLGHVLSDAARHADGRGVAVRDSSGALRHRGSRHRGGPSVRTLDRGQHPRNVRGGAGRDSADRHAADAARRCRSETTIAPTTTDATTVTTVTTVTTGATMANFTALIIRSFGGGSLLVRRFALLSPSWRRHRSPHTFLQPGSCNLLELTVSRPHLAGIAKRVAGRLPRRAVGEPWRGVLRRKRLRGRDPTSGRATVDRNDERRKRAGAGRAGGAADSADRRRGGGLFVDLDGCGKWGRRP